MEVTVWDNEYMSEGSVLLYLYLSMEKIDLESEIFWISSAIVNITRQGMSSAMVS